MAIVRTDIPMTSALCKETVQRLLENYPFLRVEQLTTTAFGRPLQVLVIGEGDRKVLYSASHHANEWITTPVLLKFVEDLAEAITENTTLYGVPARTISRAATIYIIPMVDPDGVDLVTGAIPRGTLEYETASRIGENFPNIPFPEGWKANLLGVDLNLQYPAGWLQAREIKFSQGYTRPAPRDYVGEAPLDQPESRAMAEITAQINPRLTLSYHSQGEVIYWKYLDIEPPGAEAIGRQFAQVSGYTLEDTPFASGYAGYKDWFIQQFRRPGYTIEVGMGDNPLPISQFDKIYRDNLGILVTAALGLPG